MKDKEHEILDQKIDKLEEKVDEVKVDVVDLKLEIIPRLDVYNEQLKEHIQASKSNSARLKHVEDHVTSVQGFFKGVKLALGLTTGLGTVIGMLWAVFKLIGG